MKASTLPITLFGLCFLAVLKIREGRWLRNLVTTEPSSNLRVLAFGTSRTWGAGLISPSKPFPHLLGAKNVTNLAIRGAGPSYPSMCLKSMIGDEVYDVILLEYYMQLAVPSETGKLLKLAKRARQRFPEAKIVVLQVHTPHMYQPVDNTAVLPHRDYYNASDVESPHRALFEQTADEDWHFLEYPEAVSEIKQAAAAVNGTIVAMPRPNSHREAIATVSQYFLDDQNHYNEVGHAFLAGQIKQVLADAKRQDRVNDYAVDDWCDKWYQSGKVHLEHSPMILRSISPYKHALEIEAPSSWVKLNNPMQKAAHVILYYMANGAHKYPNVRVKAHQRGDKIEFDELIHPTERGPLLDMKFKINFNAGTVLGTIPPGETTMTIEPVETTKLPFLMTAVAVVEMADDETTFFRNP